SSLERATKTRAGRGSGGIFGAMHTPRFDVVVIGTGPGGEGAAMQASKLGKRVAVVEKNPSVGGSCTHSGTIPSKALRQSVDRLMEFRTNPLFRDAGHSHEVSFPDLVKSANRVVARQVELRTGFYDRNLSKIFHGTARILDPHTIEIERPDGS